MSLGTVLAALEKGDHITVNNSGGANAGATDELEVRNTYQISGYPIAECVEVISGDWWRVGYDEYGSDLYLVHYAAGDHYPDAPARWRRFDVVETLELVGSDAGGDE